MQLVTVESLPRLSIPEPVFPMNVQLVTVGLLLPLYIPPPLESFSLKVQLVTVGLLRMLAIPPPL